MGVPSKSTLVSTVSWCRMLTDQGLLRIPTHPVLMEGAVLNLHEGSAESDEATERPEATLGRLGVLQILCAVPPGQFDWVGALTHWLGLGSHDGAFPYWLTFVHGTCRLVNELKSSRPSSRATDGVHSSTCWPSIFSPQRR